jgi:hypothetical protein
MAEILVKENHLHFGGRNYFRVGAESVKIMSYGEKRSPLTKGNYLDVYSQIPIGKSKIKNVTVLDDKFAQTTEKNLFANIRVPLVFNGKEKTALKDLLEGRLKLAKLEVSVEDLEAAANDSPKAIDKLIDFGDDARIVGALFVVMEAEMAESFDSSTSIETSVVVEGIKITTGFTGSSSGKHSFTISDGSCFAYGMRKLKWDANQKKNKTRIVDTEDDYWGLS